MINRTAAADALHQSGDRDEARELFAAAERMQQEHQPQFDLLYSLQGFQYCDLLLAPAERAAWRVLSGVSFQLAIPTATEAGAANLPDSHDADHEVAKLARRFGPRPSDAESPGDFRDKSGGSADSPDEREGAQTASWKLTPLALTDAERTTALDACTEAECRCKKLLEWRQPNDSILDIALEDLTLARATLYASLLRADSSFSLLPSSFQALSAAVHGLRKAGTINELPKGLLTAAVWHAWCGERSPAIEALNEALQIAQRGPMPLYHADILLTRARLFAVSVPSTGPVPTGQPATESGSADSNESASGNQPYPWDSSPQEDLREARRLIAKHGYWRRKEELEDAEIAIFGAVQA